MKRVFLVLIIVVFSQSIAFSESSWQDVTSGIDDTGFNSIASYKSNIAYVAAPGGIYKSADSGKSWQKSFNLRGERSSVNFIAIHPRNSNIVYAASDEGLYFTVNGGDDWRRLFSGIGRKKIVQCLDFEQNNPDKLYIGTDSGMWRSVNGGEDWARVESLPKNIAIYHITIHSLMPALILCVSEKGLLKSIDSGGNWTNVFSSTSNRGDLDVSEVPAEEREAFRPKARIVAIHPVEPSKMYLGTEEGVFESLDFGESWQKISFYGLASTSVNFLAISKLSPYNIYAGTNKGLYQFIKDEDRWIEVCPDLGLKNIQFISASNNNKYPIWVVTENGVYKEKMQKFCESEIAQVKAQKLLTSFEYEPQVREIQEAAIRYAEVHPEKIASWRRAVKGRAFLPRVSFGIDESISDTYEIYTSSTKQYSIVGPDDETQGWDVNLTWDLGDLIWSDDQTQIDVRSKLMVQLRDDILDEVTRYYFERRKLQIELLYTPPEQARTRIQRELRLQELTANIDALTDGYLSDNLK